MKSKRMKNLAFLGIAAGLISLESVGAEANVDASKIDLDYVIAKPKCSAHGGCGGLTAYREITPGAYDDADLEDVDDGNASDEAFYEEDNDRPKAR